MLRVHGGEAECREILDGRLEVDLTPAVADVEDGNAAPRDLIEEFHRARHGLGATLVHGRAPPERIVAAVARGGSLCHATRVVRDGLIAVEDDGERFAAASGGVRLRPVDRHECRIVALVAERTVLCRGAHPEERHILGIGELLCAYLLLSQRQRHRCILRIRCVRRAACRRRGWCSIAPCAAAEQECCTAERESFLPLILPLDFPCVHCEMLLFLRNH